MASFCKECSKEIFGEDYGDLAGLVDPVMVDLGYSIVALCEHCGICLVDDTGKAVHRQKEIYRD